MQLIKFFHTENTSNFKKQTAKNGGFSEELLGENDFKTALVNFCCYEYDANASEEFQKISTRILLRVFQRGRASYDFFLNPLPTKTDAPHGAPIHLK